MFRKILKETLFNKLLKQGGNAVKGVQRINKQNIPMTVNHVINDIILLAFPNLNKQTDIFLLGSTGKKQSSGDIDIGIDFTKLNKQKILDGLNSLFVSAYDSGLCKEIKINNVTYDMLHISFPQYTYEDQKLEKTVQIDILLTPYKEFCKFYMYSPSEKQSRYKGAHRNDLLRAIIKTLTYKPLYKRNEQILKWKQYDLNSMGMYEQEKTLIDNKGNKLKYKDTDQDLIPSYAKVIHSKPITHSPYDVIHILVGQRFNQMDIDTFQKLFKIISFSPDFKYKKARYQILKEAAISIKENNKLIFPEELIEYLE